MPTKLSPRPSRQTPAQAQARVRAAKERENHIRRQAQGVAGHAKEDQKKARLKQAEIERLRKVVRDCAAAVSRAKAALIQFLKTRPASLAGQLAHDAKKRQLEAAVQTALVALQAARAALEAAMRDAAAIAESPAQQIVADVNTELQKAKQDTQEEVKAAIEAGVPASSLPPPTTPAEQNTDTQVSEVAKDAAPVADQTISAAEDAGAESDKAAAEADAPPGAASTKNVLPILAVVGVVGLLLLRKK